MGQPVAGIDDLDQALLGTLCASAPRGTPWRVRVEWIHQKHECEKTRPSWSSL